MPRLQAIREVRYAGVTYLAGDTFDASDKDAKLLKAIKKAVAAAEEPAVEIPKEEPPAPNFEAGHYRRRDMRAEDGRIGETISLQSSRRGRPRKVPVSED